MKIAVVGAGVVGVLTAHYLHASGHEVTVFDGEAGPANLTSKANGAQLSYSYTDAMGSPGLVTKIPGILLGTDPAFRIAPSLSPSFLSWGAQFLRNCSSKRAESNTLALQKLALCSAQLMEEFGERFGAQFNYKKSGKLVLLPKYPDANTQAITEKKKELGCDLRLIDPDEALSIEPGLKDWDLDIRAALYSPLDASGDPRLFSSFLCEELRAKGVDFCWRSPVTELVTRNNKLVGLKCNEEMREFDSAVICTAEDHEGILNQLGIRLPILPVAGYSVTLPANQNSPTTSVTALEAKTVFCRLGDQVRIAGFADINVSAARRTERIATLMNTAKIIAPEIADYSHPDIQPWMGFRPLTPSSQPICSETKVEGLVLNLGHGTLGWTLAAATAKKLADGLGS